MPAAADPGRFLTGPQSGTPLDIAWAYIRANQQAWGYRDDDFAETIITDHYTDADTGTTVRIGPVTNRVDATGPSSPVFPMADPSTASGGSLDLNQLAPTAAIDVTAGNTLTGGRRFSDFMIDGVGCAPDGVKCDVDGNVWCSSNAGRAVGYSGVTIWSPAGKLIGRIRLPEVCGNLCFGGPKRNRLFMAASQSLYAVYVNTQGA